MKTNINAAYIIREITHTYPKPFKAQKLWWLFIGDKRVHSFDTKADALRGAKGLARRWPAAIAVN